MEVKVPKEIRNYQESIFFGLSTRQFICSLLAVGWILVCARGLAARKWDGCASSGQRPSPPAASSNIMA